VPGRSFIETAVEHEDICVALPVEVVDREVQRFARITTAAVEGEFADR